MKVVDQEREPDEVELSVGVSKLGRCTSDKYLMIRGEKVYPALYGKYCRSVAGCGLHRFVLKVEEVEKFGLPEKTCGNCRFWSPRPSFLPESYE